MNQQSETLMRPEEVATALKVEVETLNVWRCTKRYPLPYVKIGRCVRYRASDVQAFIEAHCMNTPP